MTDILILKGTVTGKLDDNGKMIRCGDKVSLYQYKPGFTEYYGETNAGTRIRYENPIVTKETSQTIFGYVEYDPKITGFIIRFKVYLLGTGKKKDNLYMFGKTLNYPEEFLQIIE